MRHVAACTASEPPWRGATAGGCSGALANKIRCRSPACVSSSGGVASVPLRRSTSPRSPRPEPQAPSRAPPRLAPDTAPRPEPAAPAHAFGSKSAREWSSALAPAGTGVVQCATAADARPAAATRAVAGGMRGSKVPSQCTGARTYLSPSVSTASSSGPCMRPASVRDAMPPGPSRNPGAVVGTFAFAAAAAIVDDDEDEDGGEGSVPSARLSVVRAHRRTRSTFPSRNSHRSNVPVGRGRRGEHV